MTFPLIERNFRIRYHEVDHRGFARPAVMLALMQDAAAEHAMMLGVSVRDLLKRGLTWVISRITLDMERYPRSEESVNISTWPALREGRFTVRDFSITDESALEIGRATTSWAVLDLKSRRPVALDEHLPPYPLHHRRAFNDDFSTLPRLGEEQYSMETTALRADMDINRHVNNTVFATWGLESVPSDIIDTMMPARIEIAFRAEAFNGERIRSSCSTVRKNDGRPLIIHRIDSASSGRELARMRTLWTGSENPTGRKGPEHP